MPTERQRERARVVLGGPVLQPIVDALDARVSVEDLAEVIMDTIDAEPNRIVRWPEVVYLTGLSRSNLNRRIRRGTFPAPYSLGGLGRNAARGWYLWEVLRWLKVLARG